MYTVRQVLITLECSCIQVFKRVFYNFLYFYLLQTIYTTQIVICVQSIFFNFFLHVKKNCIITFTNQNIHSHVILFIIIIFWIHQSHYFIEQIY